MGWQLREYRRICLRHDTGAEPASLDETHDGIRIERSDRRAALTKGDGMAQGYALRPANDPQKPGFAAAAILTLALGIGGTTAIFSFVDAVLLKPLPFPGADRILNVWEKPPGGERNGISTLSFLDWKNQNTVFTAMACR